MHYTPLGRTGLRVPAMSAGTAGLGGEYGPRDKAESIRTVHRAINLGVTYWDTSPYYGRRRAEELLGKALVGQRDKVVLSTKTGRYGLNEFDFTETRIRQEFDHSLWLLHTDHVDLLFAHDIEFANPEVVLGEGIPTLVALKREGKARYVGVSGYPLDVLQRASDEHDLDVILSYCHSCLNNTRLAAYASEWHPAPAELLEAGRQAVRYCADRGVDLTHLAMQFALSDPAVDTVMTGASCLSELEANLYALSDPIDEAMLQDVLRIFEPVRNVEWLTAVDGWRVEDCIDGSSQE